MGRLVTFPRVGLSPSEALQRRSDKLSKASRPEDVFGILKGDSDAQVEKCNKLFRAWMKVIHPDRMPDDLKEEASKAVDLLVQFRNEANARIAAGVYGSTKTTPSSVTSSFVLNGKLHEYRVDRLVQTNGLYHMYHCLTDKNEEALIKIIRFPGDNDLAQREVKSLQHLMDKAEDKRRFPSLLESFSVMNDGKKLSVTVLPWSSESVSLVEVIEAYPNGLDPRDAAWMFNRILETLMYAHAAGVIHGAVLPPNFLIFPKDHAGVLCEWSYSCMGDQKIPALVSGYESWYPPEVLGKQAPYGCSDLYLAAQTMVKLFGGYPGIVESQTVPKSLHSSIVGFLQACLIPNPVRRLGVNGGVKEAYSLFQDILKDLYGPKKFRPFSMPVNRTT